VSTPSEAFEAAYPLTRRLSTTRLIELDELFLDSLTRRGKPMDPRLIAIWVAVYAAFWERNGCSPCPRPE
jgi:hypothetical protein